MATSEELLKEMYSKNLDSQKASLEQDYNKSVADLNEQKIAAQRNTDASLNRTAVEAQKARNNFAETQSAYGLTSGAQAQARLAQNNAELANMTAIRAKQQENDAQLARQKALLSDQYNAAIREAQATNDYKLAEQLYADAKAKEKSGYSYYGGGKSGSSGSTSSTAGTEADAASADNGSGSGGITTSQAERIASTAMRNGYNVNDVMKVLGDNGVSYLAAINAVNAANAKRGVQTMVAPEQLIKPMR